MKVSIIVPVYNIAGLLGRCLDSIISQTFTCWECICVNDGSSDASAQVLQNYAAKDARIKVIHQQNAGVSAARNAGLKAATGEYIMFIDGDDIVAPELLAKMEEAASHPAAPGMVTSGYWECDEDGNKVALCSSARTLVFPAMPQPLTAVHVEQSLPVVWAKIYRNSIIKQHGLEFDTQSFIGEDTIFDFKYMMHIKNVSYVNEGLYMYCRRLSACTANVSRGKLEFRRYKDITKSFIKLYAFLPSVELYLPSFQCYALILLRVVASCKIIWQAGKSRSPLFRLLILFRIFETVMSAALKSPVKLWRSIAQEAIRLRKYRKIKSLPEDKECMVDTQLP